MFITLIGHEKWIKCLYQLNSGEILSGSDDKTIKFWKYNECFFYFERTFKFY